MIQSKLIGMKVFPVMGEELTSSNSMVLDFSESNQNLAAINFMDTAELSSYVFDQLSESGVKYGAGGYNEERVLYQRSKHFDSPKGSRFIHLGIDVWASAGHEIFSPLDGVVHSFQDNAGFGNYGPTLILKHQLAEEHTFFSLYGHLAHQSVLTEGDSVSAGQKIAVLGAPPTNGDWPPHLHFQLMTDVPSGVGDFAGVSSLAEREKYLALCPDPNLLLRHPLL